MAEKFFEEKKKEEISALSRLIPSRERTAAERLDIATVSSGYASAMQKNLAGGESAGKNILALGREKDIERKTNAPEILFPNAASALRKNIDSILG